MKFKCIIDGNVYPEKLYLTYMYKRVFLFIGYIHECFFGICDF
ncbi:hypothetical protein MtrunA17_Chr6g0460861 [Medicago truncatula]|uniref:Uncharacterized protein n=1 Tax=Medicago truncatula TaxID=3880 RepID=A0A396HDN6_MEDTR|nr:hypothetical protein MtrunA17_Chr6g0460861 [Medicago truncatula]